MSTRLSVNISDETARALRELAERNETSVTDIIRRAVSVFKFVEDEVDDGKTLQLVDRDEVVTLALV